MAKKNQESLRGIGKQSQSPVMASRLYIKRLILSICLVSLTLTPETLNAYPPPTPPPQLLTQNDSEADRLFNEGWQLFDQQTAESYRQAIEKWKQALSLYQRLGDKAKQALTSVAIGFVYKALGEQQQALDYYNQALPLYRAVGDRTGEARTLNNIGAVYDDLGEKQQALDYYSQALPLYRAVGDQSGEATTLNNIGGVYSDLGEKQQALDYYNQALPLRRAVGDRGGEATTLNNIGAVYDALGEKQQALDYYNQALPLRRAVGDRTGEATTLNNIGAVYDALGEKQQALDYYNQALPLWRAVGDRGGEATTLNNIGLVYSDLGEKQQALDYYNQALPLRRAVGDRGGEATTLNNIGAVYNALGEKQQALDYYNQALPLYRAVGARSGEAATLNNIGLVYDDLGEKQQALDYYNQALPLYRAVGDRTGEARTLNNIGLVYDDLGEKQQALDYYNQALPLYRAVGDRGGEATTLNNIGKVYDALGEKQQALDYYNQALPLRRAVGDRGGEATTLNNIGKVYSDLGEKQQALDYYNQALPLWRAVGDRSGEATTLYNIAYLERSRGNLQAALTPIKASIEIIEILRTKIISPELRQTYFATVQDHYQFYINLLMELHQQNPSQGYDKQAFNISERSRARVLLELLTEGYANIKEGIDPQLLAQEKSLQTQLDGIQVQILNLGNNPNSTLAQKTALEQQQKKLLADYENLQNQIRKNSPKYADLKYPQPLTLEQVQQQILDPDTVLLQYSLGLEKSYLWVVTQEGINSYVLPPEKEIEKRAKNLLLQITQGNPETIAQAEPLLSDIILKPVKDKLTKKRLLIVADGVLQYVPFAALSLTENQQPLVTQYEIVHLPSSSSLATIRQEQKTYKPAPKKIFIFADPVFSQDDQRVHYSTNPQKTQPETVEKLALDRSLRGLEISKLPRLPGTRQEAENILKIITETPQKDSAYDFDANLNTAINTQLDNYQIVHFATHGILNTEAPELSGVVLSLVDQNGNTVNGFLRLNEIFNLKLNADLVLISACQTALGKQIKGEGLIGITRGFMYAGSPRLLVSLWKVDDAATAEIMTRFYRLMLDKNKDLTPAEALREAQLEMQQETEYKSPYYWAAFILQGEWRP